MLSPLTQWELSKFELNISTFPITTFENCIDNE
jgi:hypothetical protein